MAGLFINHNDVAAWIKERKGYGGYTGSLGL